MNQAWSRGIELVRENFQLLAVIAGVFLLLPTMAAYLLVPDFQELASPTADPEIVAERMGELIAPLLGVGIFAAIFQFAGHGAMIALMGSGRPTVGQALKTGFKVVPSTFAILLIFVLGYFVASIVIIAPVTLLVGALGAPALAILAVFAAFAFVAWLMARMSMSLPALVLEDTLNPFKAVIRSFRLTGPKQWPILLFWVVLVVIYFIIALLLSATFGLLVALMGQGVLGMIVLGLLNGVIGMASGLLICGLAVAVYHQLAGPGAARIEDTFR